MDFDLYVSAIAAGDADAFGRWIAGSEQRIRLSLARYATHVDVEAVVQETLLRVWQVAPRFQPDGGANSLLRFAIRVARNAAISELRRHGKHEPDDAAAEESSEPVEPDPRLRELIVLCREQLPRKPAEALDARLHSGGTVADVALAADLHMTLNTFLQNVTRARRLLADCLERKGVPLTEVLP